MSRFFFGLLLNKERQKISIDFPNTKGEIPVGNFRPTTPGSYKRGSAKREAFGAGGKSIIRAENLQNFPPCASRNTLSTFFLYYDLT